MDENVITLQKRLDELAGQPLNANSPAQLVWYFYDHLGHKPYLKKGKVTTDDTALTRLLRKGVKEAKIVKEIRTLRKLSSTYTDLDKVDADGRIRCSYNPVGTVTGRISSSKNIYGTGMNMQNWPHSLHKYLLADDGYVYYSLDLSQIENRIVAYVGRVPRMMDAFETGKDVHSLTASLIFDKPVEEISNEEGSSPLGTGTYSERFWGKKSNHSFNYDLGFRSFALLMEMPENEAKWLIERYHRKYPEVRGNYHSMVKLQLSKDRTLTNLFGRKRVFLGMWEDKLFKEAFAHIPQSTTADKINRQGLSYIYNNQDKFGSLELLNQVHDSIGFQLPITIPWTKHAEILIDIKKSMETPLTWGATEFVVPVDIQMGLSMSKSDGVEFKHGNFPSTVQEFAKELERAYNGFNKE
jgi:DNA polymerase-1